VLWGCVWGGGEVECRIWLHFNCINWLHELQRLFSVNWHYDYIQLTGEVWYKRKFLCSLIDTI
jgi:hypothetical protein